MLKTWHLMTAALAIASVTAIAAPAAAAGAPACAPDNAGLKLPDGFCATVFADKLGAVRHMVVTGDGTVYLNSWVSPFKSTSAREPGGFIFAMKDTTGDGTADSIRRFGADSADKANTGGSGIALHNGYLYVTATGNVVRYKLPAGGGVPKGKGEVILTGLPLTGNHTMHSLAIDKDGALFVSSGSATNACQVKDRNLHSPGIDPCTELETRAGIWKYSSTTPNQAFGPKERYATGLRNSVAIAFDPDGNLIDVPHGRDNLADNWPEKFTPKQGSDLPSEMMVKVTEGADYGWPYCYYDQNQNKYILAPEYGGDGKMTKRCENLPPVIAAYGGHWAPDALLFYTSKAFGPHYEGGAFIAFHGSWNRQPNDQEGYDVVFQPMKDAKATGKYEIFADDFAGPNKSPFGAQHRPTGLAMGPDGALYVSDDQGGRVYRIVHK